MPIYTESAIPSQDSMRVGFTGTREGMTEYLRRAAMRQDLGDDQVCEAEECDGGGAGASKGCSVHGQSGS